MPGGALASAFIPVFATFLTQNDQPGPWPTALDRPTVFLYGRLIRIGDVCWAVTRGVVAVQAAFMDRIAGLECHSLRLWDVLQELSFA